jgi:hypothetical protein
VEDHSFFVSGPDVEQAIPYGIYDITRNTGWVNVGVDHDTASRDAKLLDQFLHPQGRYAQQIAGGHHRHQGLLGPAPVLQQPVREV